MSINSRLFKTMLAALAVASLFASCHKDDDDDIDYNYDDPRLRAVKISGLSNVFIVNDYEGLIYNYDSLSYGTSASKFHPVFYGYAVMPKVFYDKGGEWVLYPQEDTTFKLDLSKDLKLRVLSVDSSATKDYTFNLRIHSYDVESYEWNVVGSLSAGESAASYKCISYKGKYYYFYSDAEGASYVMTSSDVEKWSAPEPVSVKSADWNTLCLRGDELAVMCGSDLYVGSSPTAFIKSEALLPSGYTFKAPLFTLGSTFYAVAVDSEGVANVCALQAGASSYAILGLFPSSFDVEKFKTCVSPSGSSMLGYVFSQKSDGGISVSVIDLYGNVMDISQNQSPFGYSDDMVPFYYGDALNMLTHSEKDVNVWSSTDMGRTWTLDKHKLLPSEITNCVGSSIVSLQDSDAIYYIGGEVSGDSSTKVWKGVLKQYLLEKELYAD